MRVKRQKRHRRCVRFYTTCFGFRDPFKVFCDGTFIHHLLANQITSASDALSNLLGAPTKLFTTRCVIAELKSLGDSYSKSFHEACNLSTARCDHEKRKSAVRCIEDVIGGNNPEHFFVATQDTELRKKLEEALPYSHTVALLSCMDLKNKGLNQGKDQFHMPQDFEIPGVPLIYGLRKSLLLEPPSAFQRQFVKSSEEGRLHLSDLELKMLQKGTSTLASQVTTDSSDTREGLVDQVIMPEAVRRTNARRTLGVMDKPTFKRKKPKGPNPLSVKKKKTNGNPSHPPKKDDGEHASGKKNRKRKRSRKGSSKIGGEAD